MVDTKIKFYEVIIRGFENIGVMSWWNSIWVTELGMDSDDFRGGK